jgi:hypothetical protein
LGIIKPLDSTRGLVHPSNNMCNHSNRPLGSPKRSLLSQVLDVGNLTPKLVVVVSVQKLLGNKIQNVANAAESALLRDKVVLISQLCNTGIVAGRVI